MDLGKDIDKVTIRFKGMFSGTKIPKTIPPVIITYKLLRIKGST